MRYTTIGTGSPAAREVSVISLGAMRFGTRTDEATSFAILDRYVAAGGNFIDTSNNYLFLVHGTQGGESEALLGMPVARSLVISSIQPRSSSE